MAELERRDRARLHAAERRARLQALVRLSAWDESDRMQKFGLFGVTLPPPLSPRDSSASGPARALQQAREQAALQQAREEARPDIGAVDTAKARPPAAVATRAPLILGEPPPSEGTGPSRGGMQGADGSKRGWNEALVQLMDLQVRLAKGQMHRDAAVCTNAILTIQELLLRVDEEAQPLSQAQSTPRAEESSWVSGDGS